MRCKIFAAGNLLEERRNMSNHQEKPGKDQPARNEPSMDRRSLFKALGAGAAVAVTPVAITPAQAMNPGNEEKKARYRESDHVKAFYATNRY
jgi:hypothetical protein